ncbi:hypothetical protein HETIRDRAFT_451021 [Heterobasidion irregulare TC 32-1]|uniref:Uncharacterized protein n=1 Tax=Heterobasidion irregulare (strain TC 32-1) TaxID=747525 RepID=W4KC43_HETIT|nr:uncharacterized protein HETIRDRAFT_451021 [Heterobasidion irregulare TC 32-1]ETW83442.1 hypothetical protein HETIRDRAFT_451021 [Heterobasidion irregulare TC 32-1]
MLAYRLHANDGHTGRTRLRRNRMGSALDNVGASGGTKHRSRIAHDLVKHEQCKFDDMLQYFLERCLIDPNAAPNDARLSVLQSCLEGVLPICNSEDMKQRLVH